MARRKKKAERKHDQLSSEEEERLKKVGERFRERDRRADAEAQEATLEAWDLAVKEALEA